MGRIKIQTLAVAAVFLVLTPITFSLPYAPQRPLCLSQFALVNQACAFLPFTLPGTPGNNDEPDEPDVQVSQQSGNDTESGEHHHHHHHHYQSPAVDHCCRWLKNLDDACVCELLLRLPPFLRRVAHSYVITIDDDCEITYKCQGLLA